MSEDKSQEINEKEIEACPQTQTQTRTPLGDVTNQVIRKRSFSSLSSSSQSTSQTELHTNKKKCSESGLEGDTKEVEVAAEQSENKKVNAGQYVSVSDDATGLSPLKGGKVYRLHSPLASTNTGAVSGTRVGTGTDPSGSALDRIDLGGGGGGEGEGVDLPNEVMGDVKEKNFSEKEAVGVQIAGSKLVELPSFSLNKCSGLNVGSCSNLSADLDSLKSCSCTFCTKAAYIWSDLHYKDVKERVSVSMKSQKEASDLAQRYILETEMSRLSQGVSANVGNTEHDLSSQWKSLFVHMENVFGSETSILQADLQALRGIRDDYKSNLEMIDSLPVDVHPCSSNSSDH